MASSCQRCRYCLVRYTTALKLLHKKFMNRWLNNIFDTNTVTVMKIKAISFSGGQYEKVGEHVLSGVVTWYTFETSHPVRMQTRPRF